jgi:hypothetical protein
VRDFTAPASVSQLLRGLESAGGDPRPAGDGCWIATCPECKSSLVEIRAVDGGPPLVSCVDAHERRRAA